MSPIHDASKDTIISLLKERGATLDSRDRIGRTVLHHTYNAFHSDRMASLIRTGANLNVQDDIGWTPLHYFCYAGMSEDVTELLIQMGANVNIADSDGWTPLHVACWRGRKQFLQKLLDNGASCDAKTKNGESPHQIAKDRGHQELARILALVSYLFYAL
jgi:ankyrin repeat protein